MIALQEDRPGLIHLAVNFAPGRLVAFHVIMDLHAVQNHSDSVPDDRCLDSLPFAGRFGREFVRRLEIVDRAVPSDRGLS